MKRILFLALAMLGACGTGGALMTMNSFYEIPVGASSSDIVQQVGPPYAIHKKSDGTVEYEYIERINASARNLEERHYYIILKDDRVVSKRVKHTSPPAYTFDSYEMQTTQNQSRPMD
ncbi:MAG: hypothetical protein JSS32_08235 [Verrucomicrobia bacterium]|nr:hypothetical protein [Verrucomicrobiota bacterium]